METAAALAEGWRGRNGRGSDGGAHGGHGVGAQPAGGEEARPDEEGDGQDLVVVAMGLLWVCCGAAWRGVVHSGVPALAGEGCSREGRAAWAATYGNSCARLGVSCGLWVVAGCVHGGLSVTRVARWRRSDKEEAMAERTWMRSSTIVVAKARGRYMDSGYEDGEEGDRLRIRV